MKKIVFLTILLVGLCSCEKKYQIAGQVFTDCEQTTPYANQEIVVMRRYTNGTSSWVRELLKTKTDANGIFSAAFKSNRSKIILNPFDYDAHEFEFSLEKGSNDLGSIVFTKFVDYNLTYESTSASTIDDTIIFEVGQDVDTIYGPFTAQYLSTGNYQIQNYHPEAGGILTANAIHKSSGITTEHEVSVDFLKCQGNPVELEFGF